MQNRALSLHNLLIRQQIVDSLWHCKPLFKTLNIFTVPSLFILDLLFYITCILNSLPKKSLVHCHNNKNSDQLRISQCNNLYTAIIKNP